MWLSAVDHLGAQCSCVQQPTAHDLRELNDAMRALPSVNKMLQNARARNELPAVKARLRGHFLNVDFAHAKDCPSAAAAAAVADAAAAMAQ